MTGLEEKIARLKERFDDHAPRTAASAPARSVPAALAALGHDTFRPGQQEPIDAILHGRRPVLVVHPTGSGKSLVYQVAALATPGLGIVVSPLISLMKDQVDKLQSLGVPAEKINSHMTEKQRRETMRHVAQGTVKLLYVSPERFASDTFRHCLESVRVGLFAVDEAHCVSRWGHDFRPAYTRLAEAVRELRPANVAALTATATRRVQDDICEHLAMTDAQRFVRGVHRPNLHLSAHGNLPQQQRRHRLLDLVLDFKEAHHGTGIVYTATKKDAEQTASFLRQHRCPAQAYHAGLPEKQRTAVQNDWADNGGVVVATTAFGMGIDRPDVRFVFHLGLSPSIEDWYQEVGRAGRDGKPAHCGSFWQTGDIRVQRFLIDLTNPPGREAAKFWDWLRTHALQQTDRTPQGAHVALTQKRMSRLSGCKCVGGCIGFLKKKGLVETLGRGSYRVRPESPTPDFSRLDQLRRDKNERLQALIDFYRSRECRAASVCEYFGDETFTGECGACDNCRRKQRR